MVKCKLLGGGFHRVHAQIWKSSSMSKKYIHNGPNFSIRIKWAWKTLKTKKKREDRRYLSRRATVTSCPRLGKVVHPRRTGVCPSKTCMGILKAGLCHSLPGRWSYCFKMISLMVHSMLLKHAPTALKSGSLGPWMYRLIFKQTRPVVVTGETKGS